MPPSPHAASRAALLDGTVSGSQRTGRRGDCFLVVPAARERPRHARSRPGRARAWHQSS